jgi:hypothetical protein
MDDRTVRSAAKYITGVLSNSQDSGAFDSFLEQDGFPHQLSKEAFRPLTEIKESCGMAIDGSSCTILDGHTFIVVGQRVGIVTADETCVRDVKVGEITIDILGRHNYQKIFAQRYQETIGSAPVSLPTNLEEARDALRALTEHVQAQALIDQMEPGNVLMLDGALKGSRWLEPVIRTNCQRAAKQGVHIVGVCKRSDLYTGQLPVLSWISRISRESCNERRWYYPLSKERHIYVARLHPLARFAFRIDVNPLESSPAAVLAKLAAFADDVAYLGYPYPLAHAHHIVLISQDECALLRGQLRNLVLREGYTLEDWETVFFDYHHYLG